MDVTWDEPQRQVPEPGCSDGQNGRLHEHDPGALGPFFFSSLVLRSGELHSLRAVLDSAPHRCRPWARPVSSGVPRGVACLREAGESRKEKKW